MKTIITAEYGALSPLQETTLSCLDIIAKERNEAVKFLGAYDIDNISCAVYQVKSNIYFVKLS